jgi:site-specific recombinase XerD
MTPDGVRRALNTIAERAGVENVHPHRFRRTLATQLIDRGMSLQEVAAILGHSKLDTTMTYVYIDRKKVEQSYRRYA